MLRRHSFDPVRSPTGHTFVVTVDDVLDSLPPRAGDSSPARCFSRLVLVLAGRHLACGGAASQAAPAAAAADSAPTPGPALVVHVVGAVHRPGLYRFSGRSRVADAVARAGGATRHADLTLINLAAPLADGTQVVVPVKTPAAGTGSTAGSATAPTGPVHLNIATLEQLDSLPGVGPVDGAEDPRLPPEARSVQFARGTGRDSRDRARADRAAARRGGAVRRFLRARPHLLAASPVLRARSSQRRTGQPPWRCACLATVAALAAVVAPERVEASAARRRAAAHRLVVG